MSVVSISIRHAATVILPWTIIDGYSEGCTFLQLYEGVKSDNFDLGSWSFPEKLQNAKVSVAILNLFYHLHVSCSSRIELRRECVRRTQMPPPNRKLTSDINEIRLQRTTHDDKAAYQISNYSHE